MPCGTVTVSRVVTVPTAMLDCSAGSEDAAAGFGGRAAGGIEVVVAERGVERSAWTRNRVLIFGRARAELITPA